MGYERLDIMRAQSIEGCLWKIFIWRITSFLARGLKVVKNGKRTRNILILYFTVRLDHPEGGCVRELNQFLPLFLVLFTSDSKGSLRISSERNKGLILEEGNLQILRFDHKRRQMFNLFVKSDIYDKNLSWVWHIEWMEISHSRMPTFDLILFSNAIPPLHSALHI